MKKVQLLIFLFMLNSTSVSSQISDEFVKVLPPQYRPHNARQLTSEEKIKLLDSAAFIAPPQYRVELKKLAFLVRDEMNSTTDIKLKIEFATALGQFYNNVNIFLLDTSIAYCNKAIEYAHLPQFNKIIALSCFCNSSSYSIKGKNDSAIYYCYRAINYYHAFNDTVMLIHCYTMLSDIYYVNSLCEKSIFYNNLVLDMIPNKWGRDYTFNYLQRLKFFIRYNSISPSKQFADTILKISGEIFDNTKQQASSWYGSTFCLLGRYYYDIKEFQTAIRYADSSLLPKYVQNDLYFNVSAKKISRDMYLIAVGDTLLGIKTLDSLPKPAFYLRKWVSQSLYWYYAATNNWKQAFRYYNTYIQNLDSLRLLEISGLLADTEQKFNVAQKEQEIMKIENRNLLRQKELNQVISISLILIMILALTIVVMVGINRRMKMARSLEKQHLINELYKMEVTVLDERVIQQDNLTMQRQKIASDLHDEISTSFAAFRFYIADLEARAVNTETVEVLSNLKAEAQSIYQQARLFMHNLHSSHENKSYSVKHLIAELTGKFQNNKLLSIKSDINCDEIISYLNPVTEKELYLIIKEAVTNSIKHANATLIQIAVTFHNHFCYFSITDNGKGFPDTVKTSGNLGLNNMNNRMQNINGTLSITSNNWGTEVKGSFPV
ncbi:MAG: hypothetical protein JST86_02340 [Bacteroidetes bacterium]|nr:hypothetical protein [Bacteroidota bacterium]